MTGSYGYICQDLGELQDQVSGLLLSSPRFEDKTGYFPNKNIHTVFAEFDGSLDNLRLKLGEERHARLRDLSRQAREHFEADQDESNGRTDQGLDCILAIEALVKEARRRRPRAGE